MSMVRDDSSEAPKPSGPAQPSGAAGELFKKWSFLGEGHLGSAHSCKRAYCVDLRTFTEMLKERENIVFSWAKAHNVPHAFVFAGGYLGPKLNEEALVQLHRKTIEQAALS